MSFCFSCLDIVAPDVLHRHVKSISDSATKHLHFQAPEIDGGLYRYVCMIRKAIKEKHLLMLAYFL